MTQGGKSANIINMQNRIDLDDLDVLAESWLLQSGEFGFNPAVDYYTDGKIDFRDFAALANIWFTYQTEEPTVNFGDFAVLAESWLLDSDDPGFNPDADLVTNGVIDYQDLKALADDWLGEGVTDTTYQYYYHYDGLGSVIALSNTDGEIVETYRYDVYGRANTTGSVGNIYFFTGREYDPETGLYYYRARYYSASIGRFMQTDPTGYDDGINWYAYCGNNPIVLVDPRGLCSSYNYGGTSSATTSTSWKASSAVATGLAWADALGIKGKFGQMDTYDTHYLDKTINPYPNAGKPGAVANERAWDVVHYSVGVGLGLAVSETSAETLMRTWEMTEPGIWSGWGSRTEYQGRDVFEDGLKGIDRDMDKGTKGYDLGNAISPVFWTVYNTYSLMSF